MHAYQIGQAIPSDADSIRMRHFDIVQWTDYIHGFIIGAEKELMDAHLAQGCTTCRKLTEFLYRLQREAAVAAHVPEAVVMAARAIFLPAALREAGSRVHSND